MQKKHHILGFRHNIIGTKLSDSKTSEVGSDEEYGLLPASEDVSMDVDFPTVNAELLCFAEEEPFTAGNVEQLSRCDAAELDVIIDEYPGAGRIKGQSCNAYTQFLVNDEHSKQRNVAGLWYPFSCHEEWQVFRWLSSLHVPMDKVDEFFSLDYVCLFYLDV